MSKTFNFNIEKNDNIEIGYYIGNYLPSTKEEFTIINGNSFSLSFNDEDSVYIALFGDINDFISTPVLYCTVNGVTYTGTFYTGTLNDDFKYYNFVEYYENHYLTEVETLRIKDSLSQTQEVLIPCTNLNDLILDCGGKLDIISLDDNDIFNAIGIYKVTNDKLSVLLADRFNLVEIGDYGEIFDISKDIIKLYKTPIKNLSFTNSELIRVGGKSLQITGDISDSLTVENETNEILLQGYYQNTLDKDTIIKIIIPFFGVYNLDSKYINHNLKIKFSTNLLNNTTIAYIYIDNIIVDNISFVIGYDLPYINNNVNEDISNNKFNTDFYIVFEDKIAISNISETLKKETTINNEITNNNLSGFIKCDKIDTSQFNNIYSDDVNEIIRLLGEYIFI